MEYEARLINWTFLKGVLIGEIYDDAKERFKDGTTVRTSTVISMGFNPDSKNLIASTVNTTYLLEVPK